MKEDRDMLEFLTIRELEEQKNKQMIAWIWHDNWLKVQEIGLDAYLKGFEE